MNWDGKERRKLHTESDNDHDLLMNVNANLINFISVFQKHELEDCKRFDKIDLRLGYVEKGCWAIGGIILFVQLISRFMK